MNDLGPLLLGPPRWTIAVAESLTAGNVQARIGAVSGASRYFLGGVTAYTIEQKVALLGVDRRAAKRVNGVSAEIAEQMALGACRLMGADFGVATTGYAEPSPDEGVTSPFAWWAVARWRGARKPQLWHGRIECPGVKRTDVQAVVAEAALAEFAAILRALRT